MAVVIAPCRLFLNCTQCVHGISGFQHSILDGTVNYSFMLHVQRYLKVNAEKFTIPIDDPILVDQLERTLTYALVFLCMCILYSCFGLMFVLRKKAVYKAQLRDYNREIETIVFEVDAKRLQ